MQKKKQLNRLLTLWHHKNKSLNALVVLKAIPIKKKT
jgi:hypothetical protein